MFIKLLKSTHLSIDKLTIAACLVLISVVSASGAAGPRCDQTNMVTPIDTAYGYEGVNVPETGKMVAKQSILYEKDAAVCIEEQPNASSPWFVRGFIWVWDAKKVREYMIVRKEWRPFDPIEPVYRGPITLPDFEGRDRRFNDFRTRIRESMSYGVNFAGHFSVIEIGCGAGCRLVFLGDLLTGQVFAGPVGGEDYMFLFIHYSPQSRALDAYWQTGFGDTGRCMKESTLWSGAGFQRSRAKDMGASGVCKYISETLGQSMR